MSQLGKWKKRLQDVPELVKGAKNIIDNERVSNQLKELFLDWLDEDSSNATRRDTEDHLRAQDSFSHPPEASKPTVETVEEVLESPDMTLEKISVLEDGKLFQKALEAMTASGDIRTEDGGDKTVNTFEKIADFLEAAEQRATHPHVKEYLKRRQIQVEQWEERVKQNEMFRYSPNFTKVPSEQQVPQPFMLQGMDCYTFMLEESEEGKLQDYVDRTLNTVAEGSLRYKVLLNHVIVYMAPIEKMYSSNENLQAGWTTDNDAGFWIWLGEYEHPDEVEMAEKNGLVPRFAKKIILFPVGLFVGSSYTLITGREIYGFPKALGTHGMPTSTTDEGPFWVKTLMAREYNLENEFQDEEVWSIHKSEHPLFEKSHKFLQQLEEKRPHLPEDFAVKHPHLYNRLHQLEEFATSRKPELEPPKLNDLVKKPDLPDLSKAPEQAQKALSKWVPSFAQHAPSKDETKKLLHDLLFRGLDAKLHEHAGFLQEHWHDLEVFQVFIKQFRDAEKPDQACYQAVVEVPFIVKEYHGFDFMKVPYEFRIQHADSIELDDNLGLKPTMKVMAGLWYRMDCVLGYGKVRWVRYGINPFVEQ